MKNIRPTEHFVLSPENNQQLLCVNGHLDSNLRFIEAACQVSIHNRGHEYFIFGNQKNSSTVRETIEYFYHEQNQQPITKEEIITHLGNQNLPLTSIHHTETKSSESVTIATPLKLISVSTQNQKNYINSIRKNVLTFGVGFAGTGKTYLAVASAVSLLCEGSINKIVLVRPAVEAGEKLGYLPGDIQEKVNPYLRPVYDALTETLGHTKVSDLQARDVIEIAPLAYMRGRTLQNAFIILDEAQNTTQDQMKMFLTRLGYGSKMVITGDESQIDVPRHRSGLQHILHLIQGLLDRRPIGVVRFYANDVMRHPLVADIVQIYESQEKKQAG
ncbi:MAG: PhoH family protein [Methylacidiphilales bacterium]|nr:PhoH family protein [Candidatus Methylacidiphilales bacterium]